MTMPRTTVTETSAEARARLSLGISGAAIYEMVIRELGKRNAFHGAIADVGCGAGHFLAYTRGKFDRYIGVDVVRYETFPPEADFRQVDLDSGRIDLDSGSVDVVAALETIEHLENPRAFVRELVRIARPGGWVAVTTPNQLSLLSLLNLLVRKRFVAFQDVDYPAHLTALLEVDLRRIAGECGLREVGIEYTCQARIPMTWKHYPQMLARRFPQALSDNMMMIGRKTQ
jgi:2-polyprenyl-3-methyl-5-hydroxy-6-metoxy-1,4-benzoquinol methylase